MLSVDLNVDLIVSLQCLIVLFPEQFALSHWISCVALHTHVTACSIWKAQSRKRSPQTFEHLANFSKNVSAMFDNRTILLFWLYNEQTFCVLLFLCSLDLDVLCIQRIMGFFILITHKSVRMAITRSLSFLGSVISIKMLPVIRRTVSYCSATGTVSVLLPLQPLYIVLIKCYDCETKLSVLIETLLWQDTTPVCICYYFHKLEQFYLVSRGPNADLERQQKEKLEAKRRASDFHVINLTSVPTYRESIKIVLISDIHGRAWVWV